MGSKCPPFLKHRGASLESVTLQNLTWALSTAALFHALIGSRLLYSDDCAGGLLQLLDSEESGDRLSTRCCCTILLLRARRLVARVWFRLALGQLSQGAPRIARQTEWIPSRRPAQTVQRSQRQCQRELDTSSRPAGGNRVLVRNAFDDV